MFYIFGKWNFLVLMLKYFLYFPIFRETETLKKIPYVSGNENPKKLLIFWKMELFSPSSKKILKIHPKKIPYISGSNFPSLNSNKNPLLKRFLYFRKWNFLSPSFKYFLCFRRELATTEKYKISYISFET